MAEMNAGFAFRDSYFKAMQYYPEEAQKEACYRIVRYCLLGEEPDPQVSPLACTIIETGKIGLDNSINSYNDAKVVGKKGGRPSKVSEEALEEYLKENPTSTTQQAADYFNCSKSTIEKKNAWMNRNKPKGEGPQETMMFNF